MPPDNRKPFDPSEGARLADQLDSRQLPVLDFDHLAEWLRTASCLCEQTGSIEAEQKLLRQDYQSRITGMLKAIMIADSSRRNTDALVHLIDSLDSLPADELIACYRRTSAIFRDHFPATLPPFKP